MDPFTRKKKGKREKGEGETDYSPLNLNLTRILVLT